jgi:DNA-directed RNA polymerase specialized sigma24 family protein
MESEGSVSQWIAELKAGDEAAAERLWERYFAQLVGLCHKRLGDHPRRAADEEDMALSAFASFLKGAQQGRFPRLHDRDGLWRLLVVIAARKVVDQRQRDSRQKRGGGKVGGESALMAPGSAPGDIGIEQVIGPEPTPEFAASVLEEYERLRASNRGAQAASHPQAVVRKRAELSRDPLPFPGRPVGARPNSWI